MRASQQDGTYPRPQLRRETWHSLDGDWGFEYDDADVGVAAGWFRIDASDRYTREIVVPYPPESPASGVADRQPHAVLWYRREIAAAVCRSTRGSNARILLHFGAVDYCADVWVDGCHVAHHVGGQTPFSVDITRALAPEAFSHVVVVRAEDDPYDASQPRGKQAWHTQPMKVWYERTSGIWQSVWIESVPEVYISDLAWRADPDEGVCALIELSQPIGNLRLRVDLELAGRPIGHATALIAGRRMRLPVPIVEMGNGIDREDLLWSPERPTLIDAKVSIVDSMTDAPVDDVCSYFGIRKVGVGGGAFLLNGRPYFLRGVLNQGYRVGSHLANSGTEALRGEIELAKAMGFNTMRIHQKAEDPRILYWADRLGMLIWAEIGAAYEYTTTAVERLTAEWVRLVRRDRSHPSVVAWVPINESWGFPNLTFDHAQQSCVAGIASLTRGLDPTRPVMSNEGWEHVDSDIMGVHDYTSDPFELSSRYGDATVLAARIEAPGPAAEGRVVALTKSQVDKYRAGSAPLVVSEFGGLSSKSSSGSFAYTHVGSDTEYAALLGALFEALRTSPAVAGFCYTQLFDTAQETNGLADEYQSPKLPLETIRYIVTGEKEIAR